MREMKKGQNLQAFLEPLQTQGAAQKLQQAQITVNNYLLQQKPPNVKSYP
jgi:hypothetical protein